MGAPFANITKKPLAEALTKLQGDLKKDGAPGAAKRLEVVASQIDRLNPDMVYQWVDPSRILGELEDARSGLARWLSGARNVLALGPLVLTWIALSWASGQYQAEINAALHPTHGQPNLVTANTPFLVLWQDGFGHPTFFTFSHTAFLDFLVLLIILFLTFAGWQLDAYAHHKAVELVKRLDDAIAPLAELAGSTSIPQNANPNDWARVVQNVISKMTDEVKQVANQATTVVTQVGTTTNDLILKEMKPVVDRFQTSVTELDKSLKGVATIGATVTGLGTAAAQVAAASGTLANTLGQYQQSAALIAQNVGDLSTNQKKLADKSDQLTTTLTRATAQLKDTADKNEHAANQLNVTTGALDKVSEVLVNASRRLQKAITGIRQGGRGGLFGLLGF